MFILACGQPSPSPILAQDGAVMTIDGDGPDLLATAKIQVANLTDTEIKAAQNGKIKIALVNVRSRAGSFPIFLFKIGGMVLDAPVSLGLAAADERERLTHALLHAGGLTRNATWRLTIEIVERSTHTTQSIRMIAPSSRFWRAAADALLGSVDLSGQQQQEMLRRLYLKYPAPSQLLRRAVHVEEFR